MRYMALSCFFCEFSATEIALYAIISINWSFHARVKIACPSSTWGIIINGTNSLAELHWLEFPFWYFSWRFSCRSSFVRRRLPSSDCWLTWSRQFWFIFRPITPCTWPSFIFETFSSGICRLPCLCSIECFSLFLKYLDTDFAMSFERFSVKFSFTSATLLECGPHFWLLTRLTIILRKFIVKLGLRLAEIVAKRIAFWWSIHYCCLFRCKWILHILFKVVIWIILRLAVFLISFALALLRLLLNLLRLSHTIHGASVCRWKTYSWLFLGRRLQYLIVFLHRGPLLFPLVLMRIVPSLTVILCLTRRRVIPECHRICCINTTVAICIIHSNFWFRSRQIRFENFPVISSITSWSSLGWLWSS